MDEEGQEELHSGRMAIIPAQALDDPRITPALLKVLCVISTYASKQHGGYCYPKLRTLALRLGNVTKQAVSKNLQLLAEYGYLEIKARKGSDGRRIRNDYRVLYDQPDTYDVKNRPQVDGRQRPEVDGGQRPEVDTINVPLLTRFPLGSGNSNGFIYPSAAAYYARDDENGHQKAAAEHETTVLDQTAEVVRRHLHMSRDKLDGLRLILAQYPGRRPWLENQANLCFSTLKVRPIQLNHFSNWLDEAERRRMAPREDANYGQLEPAAGTAQPAIAGADARELSDEEVERYRAEFAAILTRGSGADSER